jgi:hypothetical protein
MRRGTSHCSNYHRRVQSNPVSLVSSPNLCLFSSPEVFHEEPFSSNVLRIGNGVRSAATAKVECPDEGKLLPRLLIHYLFVISCDCSFRDALLLTLALGRLARQVSRGKC